MLPVAFREIVVYPHFWSGFESVHAMFHRFSKLIEDLEVEDATMATAYECVLCERMHTHDLNNISNTDRIILDEKILRQWSQSKYPYMRYSFVAILCMNNLERVLIKNISAVLLM